MKSAKVCDFGIACVWKKLYDSGRELGAAADVLGGKQVRLCVKNSSESLPQLCDK